MNSNTSAEALPAYPTDMPLAVTGRSGGWMGLFALLMLYTALWLVVLMPYGGMAHDAQGYAVEALVKLKPEIYASDIFLQYRSQEEFTIFPGLYAVLIDAFGLETAAAIGVLACQLLWYTMAFLLLRQLAGVNLALFGLGLLLTLDHSYGGLGVFHFAEPFMTARLPAEVLSLTGLWLLFRGKALPAAGVLALGIAMHPLIAFPAAILAGCVWMARKFSARVVPAVLAVGVIAAIAGAFLLGGESPFMEDRWLAITTFRSSFLFVDLWRPMDWNDAGLSLLTLWVAATAIPGRNARLAAGCALGVALAGLTLAAISSLWLHLEVLIQGQPWRWTWLARFFSIGLLPAVLLALWRASSTGRSAAIILGAAWLFILPITARTNLVEVLPALLAVVAGLLWTARSRIPTDLERTLRIGAWIMAAAVLISSVVTMSLGWELVGQDESVVPVTSDSQILNMLQFGAPAAVLAICACVVARLAWTPLRGALVAAAATALFALNGHGALLQWTARPFGAETHATFADWRDRIPEDAEVLWHDSLRETWFLLERRSYLTRSQSGGIVFSDELGDEIVRRALVLEPYIDKDFWFISPALAEIEPHPLTRQVMQSICRDPELGFVVSEDDIGLATASREWPAPGERLYLYDCGDFRNGAAG